MVIMGNYLYYFLGKLSYTISFFTSEVQFYYSMCLAHYTDVCSGSEISSIGGSIKRFEAVYLFLLFGFFVIFFPSFEEKQKKEKKSD